MKRRKSKKLDAAVEQVMFVEKAKNNPSNFVISTAMNMARINDWKICKGLNSDIELDTAFTLSVAQVQLNNIEGLMMIVKYSF